MTIQEFKEYYNLFPKGKFTGSVKIENKKDIYIYVFKGSDKFGVDFTFYGYWFLVKDNPNGEWILLTDEMINDGFDFKVYQKLTDTTKRKNVTNGIIQDLERFILNCRNNSIILYPSWCYNYLDVIKKK